MHKDIDDFFSSCGLCQAEGRVGVNTKHQVIETTELDELWVVDIIGRIQGPDKTSKFILFFKWVEARVIQ